MSIGKSRWQKHERLPVNILVTGAAGFIGAALCKQLLRRGARVTGVDNFSEYYDPALKRARVAQFDGDHNFDFIKLDITAREDLATLFREQKFDTVAHLAAQAGVRYSLENPAAYVDANLAGFGNILENCRRANIKHLVFASSRSVYGGAARLPLSENDPADHPLSLYAASKKANELMAHCYAHLHRLPCTGLRFFTVYGPWGRPDMAFFKFAELMLRGAPIPVFHRGDLARDFTFIDDAVEGVLRVLDAPAAPDPAHNPRAPKPSTSDAPYKIYNLGCGRRVQLRDYIRALENALGVKAKWEMLPMQAGDVTETQADMRAFEKDFGFTPSTSVETGLTAFAEWYQTYRRLQS